MAASLTSYKELIIWQKGILLAVEVYKLTSGFPKEEIFGLTSQARRASYSVPLNIAEGYGRNTTKNYINSLYIAKGSLRELETCIILACELGFVTQKDCVKVNALLLEEFKMFNVLINTLEKKIK